MKKVISAVLITFFVAVIASAQVRDVKGTMKKAEGGDPAAQYYVGIMYETGDGLKQDLSKARLWYEKAVAQGEPGAYFRLGLLYEFGQGVPADPDKAFELFEKAGQGGIMDAQMKLAVYHSRQNDRKNAFVWMKKAAEAGHAVAQYNVATSYQVGDGVDKNYQQAIYWYKKAVEQGLHQAGPALKELEETLAKRKAPLESTN